jgi:hypothetical protein
MHAVNPRHENIQCGNRVVVAVENHVGRVEIHFKIFAFHIFDEAFETVRSFLPGFQSEN